MTLAEEGLLAALAAMCAQYLEQDGVLDHMYMGAGEQALDILASYGLVDLEGREAVWTDAGKRFLAAH